MAKKDKAKKNEEPEAAKPEGAEGEEGAAPKKKMAGKTLVLFIILPAVLVLGGGAAAAMMLMGGGSAKAESSEHGEEGDHGAEGDHGEAKADDHGGGGDHGGGDHGAVTGAPSDPADVGHALECSGDDPCYYALPKLLVNLASTEGEDAPLMEIELTLESGSLSTFRDVPKLMPRLRDQLNAFLRELRVEDLNGSEGTYRLRRELLKRFNVVMDPHKIDGVLIESIMIQ